MENDYKKEAGKQYFHYFRIWFIVIIIMAVLAVIAMFINLASEEKGVRHNFSAGSQRVFDNADVLSDDEERSLEDYIAECEDKYHFDIVVVTINEDVEAAGYWETVMMNKADDIYDDGNYGYNKIHGDGMLLLDNWYEDDRGSQKGTWLSTCGKVYEYFSSGDIDRVVDKVYDEVESSPYKAYKAGIDKACYLCDIYENGGKFSISPILIIIVPIVTALIFAMINLSRKANTDTTTLEQYVVDGSKKLNVSSDTFIRKSVSSTVISSGSSGSRSSSHSGHGGGHVSSGGVSHGGGGRRR